MNILCFALSPAVQRTLVFDRFRPGEVNRVARHAVTAAGKGVNVALALKAIGAEPELLGFEGGDAGTFVRRYAADRGIGGTWLRLAAETRTCTSIIDEASGEVTELVEEAPAPSEDDWASFFVEAARLLKKAAWLSISGALMPGAPDDVFDRLVGMAHASGVRCVIDSRGEPLKRMLKRKPYLVKLNREELASTVDDDGATPEEGARRLRAMGAEWVLVTDGPRVAWLLGPEETWLLEPPSINPLNAVGSGDCAAAGLLHGLAGGWTAIDAASFGMACGAANALSLTPADIALEDVDRLRRGVAVRRVDG